MSLDVYLNAPRVVAVHHGNITHNLNKMADAAGIYKVLWRPDECEPPITKARELIEPLRAGLRWLEDNPIRCRTMEPANKWGTYEGLVRFVREYLAACIDNPDADVEVCR